MDEHYLLACIKWKLTQISGLYLEVSTEYGEEDKILYIIVLHTYQLGSKDNIYE